MDRLRHVATSENVTAVAVAAGFIAWCGINPTGWVIVGAALSTTWAIICVTITDRLGQALTMAEHLAEMDAELTAKLATERAAADERHAAATARLDAATAELETLRAEATAQLRRAAPFTGHSFDVVRHRCEATGPVVAHRSDTLGTPTLAFAPSQAATSFFDSNDNQVSATYTFPVGQVWNLLPLHSDDRETNTVMLFADWLDNHTKIDVVIEVTDIAGLEHVYDVSATDGRRRISWKRHRSKTVIDA